MTTTVLVARATDGFLLSSNNKNLPKSTLRKCQSLLHNQNQLLRQVSLESGDFVYHFQKGQIVSVLLITEFGYSGMEAFTRIVEIEEMFVEAMGEDKIRRAATLLSSGSDLLRRALLNEFDSQGCITNGELPPRQNISTVLEKIKGQPFGFSNRVLKKKRKIMLEWKEICLLVPLTLIAFFKTIIAIKVGGPITVISNFLSTVTSFYLVFICVHGLLTNKRLIVSSFILLILTYGTTMESITSVVFNGIFALLTLANVAHYYLKPMSDKPEV